MLIDRELGQVPISIPTAIIFDEQLLVKPDVVPNDLWFNVRTLVRNLMTSMPTDQKQLLNGTLVIEDILEEMEIIDGLVRQYWNGQCQVKYYYTTFDSLQTCFPMAKYKVPTTARQRFDHAMMVNVGKGLLGRRSDILTPDIKLPHQNHPIYQISHYPIELLVKAHPRMRLLESHTGAIKTPWEWTSKLTNGNTLMRIPFNPLTLQIFGDNVNFTGFSIKVKTQIMQLAKDRSWSHQTTLSKVEADLETLNPTEARLYQQMLHAKPR